MADTTTLNESTRTVDGTESVRLATTGANWKTTLSSMFTTLGREKLIANRTYYVNNSTGSDSNNGLTSGAAFATFAHTLDVIVALDFAGFTVTIQCANLTYTESFLLDVPWLGGPLILDLGGGTINSTAGVDVTCAMPALFTVQNGTLTATDYCIVNRGLGTLALGSSLTLGAANFHLVCGAPGAKINAQSISYTISGAALAHIFCTTPGTYFEGIASTINGGNNAFAFGIAFVWAKNCSTINAPSVTFNQCGNFTGSRYAIQFGAVIDTNGGGANYFPGDSVGSGGTTAGGGFYN